MLEWGFYMTRILIPQRLSDLNGQKVQLKTETTQGNIKFLLMTVIEWLLGLDIILKLIWTDQGGTARLQNA